MKLLSSYLAFLKFLTQLFQAHHWQASGPEFYGLHLLFERLYTETIQNIDQVGEKIAGSFSPDLLNILEQTQLIHNITSKYCSNQNLDNIAMIQLSLEVEEDFLKLSKTIYDKLKEENSLTLGWDDLIMSLSNQHEGHIYLLKQSLRGFQR